MTSKRSNSRDAVIAVTAGIAVAGFMAFAFLNTSKQVTGRMLTGEILAKHFSPQPETQITIGKQGVSKKRLAGDHTLEVKTGDRTYTVFVEREIYDAKSVGDSIRFLPPPSAE